MLKHGDGSLRPGLKRDSLGHLRSGAPLRVVAPLSRHIQEDYYCPVRPQHEYADQGHAVGDAPLVVRWAYRIVFLWRQQGPEPLLLFLGQITSVHARWYA